MSHGVISALLGGVLNVGLVLLLAPLCQGVLRKVTARFSENIALSESFVTE